MKGRTRASTPRPSDDRSLALRPGGPRCAYCSDPVSAGGEPRPRAAALPEAAILWSTCAACVRALGQALSGPTELAPLRVSLALPGRD